MNFSVHYFLSCMLVHFPVPRAQANFYLTDSDHSKTDDTISKMNHEKRVK